MVTQRPPATEGHKKGGFPKSGFRNPPLIEYKMAATYSPAGMQYHRRDRA